MSSDIAANEIHKLRNEIARLKGQTNWVCTCGGTDTKGQRENEWLRQMLTIETERSAYWRSIANQAIAKRGEEAS